jgi:hypothetical protein
MPAKLEEASATKRVTACYQPGQATCRARPNVYVCKSVVKPLNTARMCTCLSSILLFLLLVQQADRPKIFDVREPPTLAISESFFPLCSRQTCLYDI